MTEILTSLFSYDFMRRAVIVGVIISLCAALLGISLVLRRYSAIGDGLSHVGFGALAAATALNAAPLAVAIPVVCAAAFLLLATGSKRRLKGDAAIALLSSSALAIGVIIISCSSGLNADINNYLFGSILAMSGSDVIISMAISAAVLLLLLLLYNRMFAVTFDEQFAIASGMRVKTVNTLLSLATALVIVIGMRIMGAMLISSLIIFPALSAMRVANSFKGVVIISAVIAVVSFMLGIIASYAFSTPAGASVVAADLIIFFLMALLGRLKK